MTTTYTGYQLVARDMTRSIELVKAEPMVERESEYYLANIGNVKSIEELLDDTRLFTYAMKAHGLSDMTYARAFMEKILVEGHDDSGAFVNQLTDQRYQEFAETFDFKNFDQATTSFTRTQQGVVDKYLRQTLEENAGSTNEGVRLALYFERKADAITSAYDILAESALATVVRTTLGMPDSMAYLDIDKQAEMIEERLDLEDLKDPEKLAEFMQRFTSLWDVANPTASTTTNTGLLFGQSAQFGLSADLMFAIQNLK